MRVTPRDERFPNDQDIEHNTIADLSGGSSMQFLKRMEGLQLELSK